MSQPQNGQPAKRERGRFVKGQPTANPGGRPKALREIEQMLTREHRNVNNMKLVFETLRMFALRGDKGDAAYAKLYLERVLGPVKDLDDLDELMRDAPPEVIEFLKKVVH